MNNQQSLAIGKILLVFSLVGLMFFCSSGLVLALEASAQATRGFKGRISRQMAATAAAADARLQAVRLAVRELVRRDEVKLFFSSEVMRAAPRPDPVALAWSLLESEQRQSSVTGVPPDMQVTIFMKLSLLQGEDIDLPRLLRVQPERLEIYARAIVLLQDALNAYDSLAEPFLRPGLPTKQDKPELERSGTLLALSYSRLEVALEYLAAVSALHPLDRPGPAQDERGNLLALLEAAARKAPDSYLILSELARLRLFHGQIASARSALDQAIKLEPEFALAYDLRGQTLLGLELPALALRDFTRAIQLEPFQAVFFENRALAHRILEQDTAMCADFTESCKLGECGGLEWARAAGFCAKPE